MAGTENEYVKKHSNSGMWICTFAHLFFMCDVSDKDRWAAIASNLPGRNGKQCRERWHNQLDPSIKRESWTDEEDRILMEVRLLPQILSTLIA